MVAISTILQVRSVGSTPGSIEIHLVAPCVILWTHEDVIDELFPLTHDVDYVAENGPELVQFLSLFSNEFFREDESPFLVVFGAR